MGVLESWHGVVTRAEAVAAGMNGEQIAWRVRSGAWKKLHRGVYLVGTDEGYLTKLAAAVSATRGVLHQRSAAAVWKLDGFDTTEFVDLMSLGRNRLDGVNVRTVDEIDQRVVTVHDGFPLTTRPRTLLELGERAHRDQVEIAMDCCIRKEWTTWAELEELADTEAARGRKGPCALREVLNLRSRQWRHTDSMLETLILQLIRYARLPLPVLQYPIGPAENPIASADFAWPNFKLIVEGAGGSAHASSIWQLIRDSRRSNAINLLKEWTVLTFTWRDVHNAYVNVCRDISRGLGCKWEPSHSVRVALGRFGERIRQYRPPDEPVTEPAAAPRS